LTSTFGTDSDFFFNYSFYPVSFRYCY